ncbi:MAG: hypothetical protein AAGK04_14420 [Planctomycetota bacterium]
MPLRLIHVGLGPLGQRVLNDLLDRQLCELVAAVDIAPNVCGKPVTDVIPNAPHELRITPAIDHLPEADIAVVTTQSSVRDCAPVFRALLEQGLTVVSTCEELLWPTLRHATLAKELDALAKAHNARLLGTGVNPGFLMDTLPAVATTACHAVTSLRVERVQDATTRRIPFQRKIGATLSHEAFQAGIESGWLQHVGLGESMHLACDAAGLPITRWDECIEPVIAESPMTCGLGEIPAGHAAGVRQIAEAFHNDTRVAEFEFVAAIGQAEPRDAVHIEGEPSIDLVIPGGVHGDIATSAVTINAIPALRAAPPGLHTMLTIRTPHRWSAG